MTTETDLMQEVVDTLRGMVNANAAAWDMPHDEFCTEYMAWSKNRARAFLAKIDAMPAGVNAMTQGINDFCEEDEEPADVCHHGRGFDVFCEDCTREYAEEMRQEEERQHHARLMRLDAFGDER